MRLLLSLGVVVVVVVGLAGLRLWWWLTKFPIDRRDAVSAGWREEHIRERRDDA